MRCFWAGSSPAPTRREPAALCRRALDPGCTSPAGVGGLRRSSDQPRRLGDTETLHRDTQPSREKRTRRPVWGRCGPVREPNCRGSLGAASEGGLGGTASGGPPSVCRARQRRLAVAARDEASVGRHKTARRQPLESHSLRKVPFPFEAKPAASAAPIPLASKGSLPFRSETLPSPSKRNPLCEQPHRVIDGGENEEEGVEAVEEAAVSGEDGAHVLDLEVAFHQ